MILALATFWFGCICGATLIGFFASRAYDKGAEDNERAHRMRDAAGRAIEQELMR